MTRPNVRLRTIAGALALVLCAGLVLSACGSSPGATTQSHAIKKACQQLSAVLSDGPDPSVDPMGYAEAQIEPLSKVKVHDANLQTGIDYLDAAYRLDYATNGSRAAGRTVKAAMKIIDIYCPGIGS